MTAETRLFYHKSSERLKKGFSISTTRYNCVMNATLELEKQILALPAVERERLATLTWESLFNDPGIAGDREIDPEGIEIAVERNAEIESGKVKPIGHAEFLRLTGDFPE